MVELRVVVADDEPLVRQAIRRFLASRTDAVLVAEARDGDEVIDAVDRHDPDILFLDIRMPGRSGFEALAALPEGRCPTVIFVTAHEEHALRAFDVAAVDYVLKPFDHERLGRALDRAARRVRGASRGASGKADPDLRRLLRELAQAASPGVASGRIPVRKGGRTVFVELDAIEAVRASGNYAVLATADGDHHVRETLSALEDRLGPHGFFRVHRSALVRLRSVTELRPLTSGDAEAVLAAGGVVRVSRTYREAFEEAMKLV